MKRCCRRSSAAGVAAASALGDDIVEVASAETVNIFTLPRGNLYRSLGYGMQVSIAGSVVGAVVCSCS